MDRKISLSDVLRAATKNKNGIDENKVYFINADEIYPHPDNEKFYKKITTDNLTDLKESIIELNGVVEPLVVKKSEDYKLYIVSGNRRREAVLELFSEGRLKTKLVPYKIKQFKNKDEELKSIILLNSQRKKSILEEKNEIIFLYNFYKKEKEEKNIKGNTREYIAEKIGISQTKLQRYLSIDSLSEKLKEKLDSEEINFSVASEFVSIPKEIQDKILDKLMDEDNLTISSVRLAKKELTQKKEAEEENLEETSDRKPETVNNKSEPEKGSETNEETEENEALDAGEIGEKINPEDLEKNIDINDYDDENDEKEDKEDEEIETYTKKMNSEDAFDNYIAEENKAQKASDSAKSYWKNVIDTQLLVLKKSISDSINPLKDEENIRSIIDFGEKLIRKCSDEKTGNNKI